VIAGLAFCVAALGAVIEYKSIKISQGIQRWLSHESEARPTVVEELDQYLSEFDEETKMTRLEAIGSIIGARMYQALRFSKMQGLSMDSKIQSRYDTEVHEAVKQKMPMETKIIYKIAEQLGFDLDEIIDRKELPQFLQALANNGIGVASISYILNSGNKQEVIIDGQASAFCPQIIRRRFGQGTSSVFVALTFCAKKSGFRFDKSV